MESSSTSRFLDNPHFAIINTESKSIQIKVRHVRDEDFWGAPAGTPLPLPEKYRRQRVRVRRSKPPLPERVMSIERMRLKLIESELPETQAREVSRAIVRQRWDEVAYTLEGFEKVYGPRNANTRDMLATVRSHVRAYQNGMHPPQPTPVLQDELPENPLDNDPLMLLLAGGADDDLLNWVAGTPGTWQYDEGSNRLVFYPLGENATTIGRPIVHIRLDEDYLQSSYQLDRFRTEEWYISRHPVVQEMTDETRNEVDQLQEELRQKEAALIARRKKAIEDREKELLDLAKKGKPLELFSKGKPVQAAHVNVYVTEDGIVKWNDQFNEYTPETRAEIEHALKAVTKEIEARVKEQWREVGITTRLETNATLTWNSGNTAVAVTIRAPRSISSDYIPTITRVIRPDEGTVTNDYFILPPKYQHHGAASKITASLEDLWREWGISKVNVHANIDVGGYAWARLGFDFSSDGQRDIYVYRMDVRLNDSELFGDDPELVDLAKEDWAKIKEAHRVTDDPILPVELALVGYREGATDWIGKRVMLGSDWYGVKEL